MTNDSSELVFYHSPCSRSVSIRWLLEELGVPYRVHLINIFNKAAIPEDYVYVQPHKKVPAVRDGSVVVTERAAIATFLSDRYSLGQLAPALDDPLRGPYLSMLAYVDGVFDPCVATHDLGLKYDKSKVSFGAYDDMLGYLEAKLSKQPYAAGDRFTAADTQLAAGLGYTMYFSGAVPRLAVFEDYVGRLMSRPAQQRVQALDAELAHELGLGGPGSSDNPLIPSPSAT